MSLELQQQKNKNDEQDIEIQKINNEKANKIDVAEKELVLTTKNKWWEGETETLKIELDGEDRQVDTMSTSYKERVVFFGSSTTEGNGAADINNSYFNLYKDRLGSEYEFYVRGYGGDD